MFYIYIYIYTHIYIYIYILLVFDFWLALPSRCDQTPRSDTGPRRCRAEEAASDALGLPGTPNLPTKIIPTKIPWLNISREFPMNIRIPPLWIKILLESNPPKSRILVRRLAVRGSRRRGSTAGLHDLGSRFAILSSKLSFRHFVWARVRGPEVPEQIAVPKIILMETGGRFLSSFLRSSSAWGVPKKGVPQRVVDYGG